MEEESPIPLEDLIANGNCEVLNKFKVLIIVDKACLFPACVIGISVPSCAHVDVPVEVVLVAEGEAEIVLLPRPHHVLPDICEYFGCAVFFSEI